MPARIMCASTSYPPSPVFRAQSGAGFRRCLTEKSARLTAQATLCRRDVLQTARITTISHGQTGRTQHRAASELSRKAFRGIANRAVT
jgi:hypothetical protein